MEQSRSTGSEKNFVGAEALQELGIVSKSAAYRMAEAGLLPGGIAGSETLWTCGLSNGGSRIVTLLSGRASPSRIAFQCR